MKGRYHEEEFLSKLFEGLPNLTALILRNNFKSGRTDDDVNTLKTEISQMGKALQSINCLCSLTFSNCGFDDDLIRLFLLALDGGCHGDGIRNTLVHLDLVGC